MQLSKQRISRDDCARMIKIIFAKSQSLKRRRRIAEARYCYHIFFFEALAFRFQLQAASGSCSRDEARFDDITILIIVF